MKKLLTILAGIFLAVFTACSCGAEGAAVEEKALELGMGSVRFPAVNGMADAAYGLLLEDDAVDRGAAISWLWRNAAGIASDPTCAGFRNIIMAPVPDRRLGFVRAEYKSPAGVVKSAWRYEDGKWIWDFTVPRSTPAIAAPV